MMIKRSVLLLLPVLIAISLGAQTPRMPANFCLVLQKVVADCPNGFANLKGEKMENQSIVQYNSTLHMDDIYDCTIMGPDIDDPISWYLLNSLEKASKFQSEQILKAWYNNMISCPVVVNGQTYHWTGKDIDDIVAKNENDEMGIVANLTLTGFKGKIIRADLCILAPDPMGIDEDWRLTLSIHL